MDHPRVKVLGKAARLLKLLADNPGSTVPALAVLLAEPRPTVYRLVQDLAVLDYVEEGPRPGTYRLGLELFRLGSLVALRFDAREAAAPVMNEIHKALEETVYLVIRRGHEAVCIERVEGLRISAMALQLGGSLPLHLGAGPRVLLAYQPRKYWDGYFAAGEAGSPYAAHADDQDREHRPPGRSPLPRVRHQRRGRDHRDRLRWSTDLRPHGAGPSGDIRGRPSRRRPGRRRGRARRTARYRRSGRDFPKDGLPTMNNGGRGGHHGACPERRRQWR